VGRRKLRLLVPPYSSYQRAELLDLTGGKTVTFSRC
jgi:hypothetical protein